MTIINLFEAFEWTSIFYWNGRIYQPVWGWVFDPNVKIGYRRRVLLGVTETDEDLSYARFISRTWYE